MKPDLRGIPGVVRLTASGAIPSNVLLLSGNLADQLIMLKDEYKEMIKFIGDYPIKHGQTMKVYSAYSDDFGNAEPPRRMAKS